MIGLAVAGRRAHARPATGPRSRPAQWRTGDVLRPVGTRVRRRRTHQLAGVGDGAREKPELAQVAAVLEHNPLEGDAAARRVTPPTPDLEQLGAVGDVGTQPQPVVLVEHAASSLPASSSHVPLSVGKERRRTHGCSGTPRAIARVAAARAARVLSVCRRRHRAACARTLPVGRRTRTPHGESRRGGSGTRLPAARAARQWPATCGR